MTIHELVEELMKIPNQELEVWGVDEMWGIYSEEPLSDNCVKVAKVRTNAVDKIVVFIDDFTHEEVDYDEQ